MYSLVLMAAMTATPEAPEFGGAIRDWFGRGGCAGCSGAARYSCLGGCSGCCGGGRFLGFGLLSRRPDGCCGGCSGSAYSCFGGPAVSYAGMSCYGGPLPSVPMVEPYPLAPGGLPGPSFPGVGPPAVIPANPPGSIPYSQPEPAPGGPIGSNGLRPAGYGGPAGTTVAASPTGPTARATVVVRLPADARLYADGSPLRMTGPERTFATPALPADQEFVYRFTAEYERGGAVVSVTKKVAVRAGGSATVEFTDLTATKPAVGESAPGPTPTTGAPVAANPVSNPKPGTVPTAVPAAGGSGGRESPASPDAERATITVRLPAGAALYVDDRKSPSTDPVRQFTTPPLPAGKEFAYLLKAEVVRDGRPEQLIQKVAFRAGEQIVVDFTNLGTGR